IPRLYVLGVILWSGQISVSGTYFDELGLSMHVYFMLDGTTIGPWCLPCLRGGSRSSTLATCRAEI
ncbi:hypothetical protein PIB30_084560, partial [Stylosanthes scabra]|nr:hypothetical protein [Stylosanthes scabra]